MAPNNNFLLISFKICKSSYVQLIFIIIRCCEHVTGNFSESGGKGYKLDEEFGDVWLNQLMKLGEYRV